MYLGISYKKTLSYLDVDLQEGPISTTDMIGIINDHTDDVPVYLDGKKYDRKEKAILFVDSLNQPDKKEGLHAIYFDGKHVLDPSTRKVYRSMPKSIRYVFVEHRQKLRDSMRKKSFDVRLNSETGRCE